MCVISIHVHCFEWSGFFGVFVFVFSPLNQAVHVHAVFCTSRRVHLYTQWKEGMPILITESPLKLSQHLDRYPCYTIHIFITVFVKHRCAVNNVDACVQLMCFSYNFVGHNFYFCRVNQAVYM